MSSATCKDCGAVLHVDTHMYETDFEKYGEVARKTMKEGWENRIEIRKGLTYMIDLCPTCAGSPERSV